MSGTGKSTLLASLAERGFRVVDTDDPGWKVREGDEWLWDEAKMSDLLAAEGDLFVSGCVANQGRFYDRFDAVVLLSATAEVILERLALRTTNEFGKTEVERKQILADLANVEPLLRRGATHEIDAARPIAEVAAELLKVAKTP